jgi:hypothetical protein
MSSASAVDLTKFPGVVAESGRVEFVFPVAKSLVVNERVTIAHEVCSVCSFVIEDGPMSFFKQAWQKPAAHVVFPKAVRERCGWKAMFC